MKRERRLLLLQDSAVIYIAVAARRRQHTALRLDPFFVSEGVSREPSPRLFTATREVLISPAQPSAITQRNQLMPATVPHARSRGHCRTAIPNYLPLQRKAAFGELSTKKPLPTAISSHHSERRANHTNFPSGVEPPQAISP